MTYSKSFQVICMNTLREEVLIKLFTEVLAKS